MTSSLQVAPCRPCPDRARYIPAYSLIDHEQENTNGAALVPMLVPWFRPAPEGPRRFQVPPRSIGGSGSEKRLLRNRRDRRRDPKNRVEHPTRSSNCVWPQHALLGRLQQTGGMSQR